MLPKGLFYVNISPGYVYAYSVGHPSTRMRLKLPHEFIVVCIDAANTRR
jgi:hypothetical protein